MRLLLLVLLLLALAACAPAIPITSFEDCVAAGNPVMESYPRQCRAGDQLFVEEIDEPVQQTMKEFTTCPDERPQACTREYRPVCALRDNGVRCVTAPCASTDAVTAATDCTACANETVLGHYPGACELNRFVICEDHSFTGFNITQLAVDNGWICTDICPGNYDEYTTQIGARMCIQHYGEEEIMQWESCDRSSDSCDCVDTYETTRGEPIDGGFRCVPDQYAERLLFRGGTTRLDENGQSSTVIA